MPTPFRTRIDSVDPAELLLTVRGSARLRVRGTAYGFVRCAAEKRWVWGAFDETFLILGVAERTQVGAFGIGGIARLQVARKARLDLAAPRAPDGPFRLRWASYRVPRLRPLQPRDIFERPIRDGDMRS